MIKQQSQKNERSFFLTITDITFRSFIGLFLGAFILFLILAILYNLQVYVNFAFYTALGLVVFLIGYFLLLIWNSRKIRATEETIDQRLKINLIIGIISTVLAYFIIAWLLMIFIGSFNGFGITFASNNQVLALTSDPYTTKVIGFILFYVFVTLSLLIFITYTGYLRFKDKANFTFNARRKMVEKVRSEAQKRV
ncbi:putative membrane protein [Mycoplasmoides fastidiosum]|uniref:Membrane protein n=1 Tax=Mycoplasmoides fastidiosum TaxID=92758 RepID=A0ABU0LYJ0_9BACT|nr:hypothetical protein [Mycoplasmoides fastidiosum]MDQ0513773.1 putative membrane protein [Mycoplasmoides fastidiosum]UUD37809.1 hypothetical protein NPA10_00205 [Mycoplasmoides fastidiosum]